MRRGVRLGVFAATMATAGAAVLAPVSAQAEEQPTARQLLMKCDNGTDVCEFHPDGPPQVFMGSSHQVGDSVYNCTPDTQRSSVSWSDTTGETNSVGISLSLEYGFSEVFKASIETSYEHTWSSSHTESQTSNIDVRPNEVGWITREAQMQTYSGTYEMHFGSPYYGHYYWYVPFTATGPMADAPSTKTQHTRAMTSTEQSQHCG